MKNYIISLIAAIIATLSIYCTNSVYSDEFYDGQYQKISAIDTYSFQMKLNVPRIYDNSNSLGKRKYQMQSIYGQMLMLYSEDGSLVDVKFTNMVNKTHRLSNGKNVSYDDTCLDTTIWPRFNVIGSNKTEKFNVASICFYLAAEPNYNIGEFDEDNALYIMLAGKGNMHAKGYMKSASGYVAGTLGCGCTAYGHVSPTRKIAYHGASDKVDDVAAVFGKWNARFQKTTHINQ